jgi:hypothetical protein
MFESDAKLERDEPSILTRVFLMAGLLLIIVDLLVVCFYFKTSARIQEMNDNQFTRVVRGAIDSADANNAAFTSHIQDHINKKNDQIRVFVSEMEHAGHRLDTQGSSFPIVDRAELDSLKTLLAKIDGAEKPSPVDLNQAVTLFAIIEKRVTSKLTALGPLDTFTLNFRGLEAKIKSFVEEIKQTLGVYLTDIVDLAKSQNTNQLKLYQRVSGLLTDFDEVYGFIYNGTSLTTLNNFYQSKFLDFENDFIPFSQVVYQKYNAAKLTETAAMELKLPRVYYCTFQAYVVGLGNFGVKFEFVDHQEGGKETVLATTDEILGSYKDPVSISEMQIFELKKGRHFLYLRVLAQRGTSQLKMRDFSHECISYRNFHEDGHEESRDPHRQEELNA